LIKYTIGLIAFLLVVANTASAQVCVSFFAAQAFTDKQCNESLQVFNNVHTPCLAILWKTFTLKQNNLCTQKFLSRFKDKPHILEIHFSNEAGRRNRRLARYEFATSLSTEQYNRNLERGHRGTLKLIQRNAKAINKFLIKYSNENTTKLVSTGLEDNFTSKAFVAVLQTIKPILQNVRFVRNPVGDYEKYYIGADYIELHGVQPEIKASSYGRCLVNLDGISIQFHDGAISSTEISIQDLSSFIERYRSKNCIVALWWKEPQGIESVFKHPRSRKFLIEPYKINLINNLIRRF
jgi:hypothetical protein